MQETANPTPTVSWVTVKEPWTLGTGINFKSYNESSSGFLCHTQTDSLNKTVLIFRQGTSVGAHKGNRLRSRKQVDESPWGLTPSSVPSSFLAWLFPPPRYTLSRKLSMLHLFLHTRKFSSNDKSIKKNPLPEINVEVWEFRKSAFCPHAEMMKD